MFESLRRSVGMAAARFAFRRSENPMITFGEAIPSSSSLLIVLPFTTPDAVPLRDVLTRFGSRFDERSISVVSAGARGQVERILPHAQVFPVDVRDVSPWYLPRRALMSQIVKRKYALAVDLNLDNILPSGYICRAAGARIRVGFGSPHADLFYNFQVRLDPSSPRGHAYDRLMECLRMFFPDEDV
jgi:hypothetical protein